MLWSMNSWWRSRFRLVFSAILAAVGIAVTGLAASASAPAQPPISVHAKLTAAQRLQAEIKLLDRYVVRSADGTLALSPPAAVARQVDSADMSILRSGLVTVNHKISAGELTTTASGRLVDPKAVAFNIQWNWTGQIWRWWGIQDYYSEYWTVKLEYYSEIGEGASAICAAIAAFLLQPEGVLLCGIALGIFLLGAGWLKAVDNGGGDILSETYTPYPFGGLWISGQ